MPPAQTSVTRRPPHRRALDVQVFARDDGLLDVEAGELRHILPTAVIRAVASSVIDMHAGDATGNPRRATVTQFHPHRHTASPAAASTFS